MGTSKIPLCRRLEERINDMIRKNFKVRKVTSSHRKNEAYIVSEEPLTKEQLDKVLETMGYRCLSVRTEPYKKSFFGLF